VMDLLSTNIRIQRKLQNQLPDRRSLDLVLLNRRRHMSSNLVPRNLVSHENVFSAVHPMNLQNLPEWFFQACARAIRATTMIDKRVQLKEYVVLKIYYKFNKMSLKCHVEPKHTVLHHTNVLNDLLKTASSVDQL
jgi:hypothetical protein